MGRGYGYKCKEFKHRYYIYPGIGKAYPKVYRDLFQKIEDGVYGEEWQRLLKDTPYAAVNDQQWPRTDFLRR